MKVLLQERVARLAQASTAQAHCTHETWEYVANRRADGAPSVWRRCKSCHANASGPGRFMADKDLRAEGIDPERVPVIHDARPQVPPCSSCGQRAEDLHWARSSRTSPASWLCPRCALLQRAGAHDTTCPAAS